MKAFGMETHPQSPVDWRTVSVEREYWFMNWINGPVIFSPRQADLFINGLDPKRFAKYPTARYYDPVSEIDEIISNLAKIKEGDRTSVLRFVATYGLLGRGHLINRTRIVPTLKDGVELDENEAFLWEVCESIDRHWSIAYSGDPLWWIYAHVRTVSWCLACTSILETKLTDEEFFQKGIYISWKGFTPPWIAIRDDIEDDGVFGNPDDPHCFWNGVQQLCDRIITKNISGMRRTQETGADGKVRSRFRFKSLIEMVYWRLADSREGGSVQQCAFADCRSFFIQGDPRQRYCPPDRIERERKGDQAESSCSRRDRIKRYRSNPENREREKQNQRRRYRRQKHRAKQKQP